MIDRAHAERLDDADPLAPFRERFVIDDPDLLYLDGNSLGRLPIATRERLRAAVDQWGSELVSGWHEWIELPERAGDLLAKDVLGARPGEVIVTDSTTVNLFKLASAVLDTRPGDVVTDTGNFPTDRYVLEGVARRHGRELRLFEPHPIDGPLPEDVKTACEAARWRSSRCPTSPTAPARWPTWRRSGPPRRRRCSGTSPIRPAPCRSSSSGAGLELAVGCTYKYLNAGPGAPAFLYVREELQQSLRTPIQGWFGQRDQFEMDRSYDPEPSVRGFLAGTPPILALAAVEEGARLIGEAGIGALREKTAALTELAIELHDERLAPLGFELASPRDAARRGGHVSLAHPEAWQICRALIERARVVPDFRGPDSIRLGLPPLYTRFTDVYDALERLAAWSNEASTSSFIRPGCG